MLTDDGALNALGQLYTGAKTVHTEVVAGPTNTYITLNGADNPTQLPATTWAALLNSAPSTLGSIPSAIQLLLLAALPFFSGFLGLTWTAF